MTHYLIKHKDPDKRSPRIKVIEKYGYKGLNLFDAGIVYSPYIPLSVKSAVFGIDLEKEIDAIKQEYENIEIQNKTESFIPPE